MTDVFSKNERSSIMSKVRNKNTRPERVVRSILHTMGYRFRLHRKDIPGKPDVVLPRHKKVIFVHGCFWHGHPGCKRSKRPSSNTRFWQEKLDKNRTRDHEVQQELIGLGWKYLVVWECETKNKQELQTHLRNFMEGDD